MTHVVTSPIPPFWTRPAPGEPPIRVEAIPAARDNLVWVLAVGDRAAVVDGPRGSGVPEALAARGLRVALVLVTHTHADHVGVLGDLPGVPVIAPRAAASEVPVDPGTPVTWVGEGDAVDVLGARVRVLATEGHLHGHVSYLLHDAVFCGDTLFAGGCGRAFQDADRLWESVRRLAALPPGTRVCCAHEYTQGNYVFARSVLPDDPEVARRAAEVDALRAAGRSAVPSTIAEELASNVFLRAADREAFVALRARKDAFRG